KIVSLRVADHRVLVMAIDGQPAEPFSARDNRVILAPGNRIDLFLDMTRDPGTTSSLLLEDPGGDMPLVRLVYGGGPPTRPNLRPDPKPLPANPLPERMEFSRALRQEVPLEDKPAGPGLAAKPLFSVKRGRTVMLAL